MQYPRDFAFSRLPLASAILATSLLSSLPLAAQAAQPAPAAAQSQRFDFNIAAQPLADALDQFSAQSGYQVIYQSSEVGALLSPGVKGQHSAEEAIRLLTAGSNARLSQPNGNSFLVDLPVNLGGDLQLDAVSISGKAPGSITEGTGLYTTYSSSSSTRLNLTPRETPQSLTVMTRQRLDDQRLTNLSDTLEATPGITVVRDGLGAETDAYWSRGFQIQNYEIDGVPTVSRMDNYTQSMAMYDRVEVVRGATGLISGLGNPSATINLIRKRPTYEGQASIIGEAGSWDRYGTGFDISGPLTETGNIRGRLVADYKTGNGWLDRYKDKSQLLYGISEFDLSESTLLTIGFSYQKTNVESPARSGIPTRFSDGSTAGLKRSTNPAPSWSYSDHEQTSLFSSLEHQFDNGWSGKVEYTHSENQNDSLYSYLSGSLNPDGSGKTLLPARFAGTPRQDTLDVYLTGPFQLFGREHELIGGLTLSQFEVNASIYGNNGYGWDYDYNATPDAVVDNLFDWNGHSAKPDMNPTGHLSQKETQKAAYLTSRFHVTDDLSFILGGRLIDWKNDVDRDVYAKGADAAYSNQYSARETGVFIPYSGLVYDLNDSWSVYASYTKIFNPQDYTVKDPQGKPLEPMEGKGYEVGIKGSHFGGKLNSSLALFKMEQDNLAIWQAEYPGSDVYLPEQATTTKGLDFEVSGELADGWQASAGYAYVVTTDSKDNRIVTTLPRNSFKTFTSYRLPGPLDKLTLGAGVNWQSKVGVDLHGFTQSSYAVTSLLARYDVSKQLSVAVNVNNLFDREYYSFAGDHGMYGAPRNLMTSFKYSF